MPEAIRIEIISRNYNNFLANHFDIEKTRKMVACKYHWPTVCHNIKPYIKDCNICLALKAVGYKLYGDLQTLPIVIDCWKEMAMDFMTGFSILTN